jgi:hypothetical protein
LTLAETKDGVRLCGHEQSSKRKRERIAMCCVKTDAVPSIPPERVITTVDEVRELGFRPGSLRGRRQKGKVVVSVPEFGAEERRRLEGTIASYVSACGCGEGRGAGILTLITFVLLLAGGLIPFRDLGWKNVVLLYLALSFSTMLLGKVYGLVRARLALAKLCRELTDRRVPSMEGVSHGRGV